MMMRSFILGMGAAGGKAVIELVKKGIVEKSDYMLVNSTLKDIPPEYRDNAIRFSDSLAGCGQERDLAKQIVLDKLENGSLNLDGLLEPQHQSVIIITSLSGGSGSGASVIFADYLRNVVKIPVEIIGLVGFSNESPRALRNIMEFCQDIPENCTVQFIRNEAFLEKANGNQRQAEKLANEEVANGSMIIESEQNIDDTDLYKLDTTPGYKTVEYIQVTDRIKSFEQFNKMIVTAINYSASVEFEKGAMKRLGMIYNLSEKNQEFIDYSCSAIKERIGLPYEKFHHVENISDSEEFIAIIATGMKMPIEEISNIYDEYQRQAEKVDTSKDNFFSMVKKMNGNKEDAIFDSLQHHETLNSGSKSKFFEKFKNKANLEEF